MSNPFGKVDNATLRVNDLMKQLTEMPESETVKDNLNKALGELSEHLSSLRFILMVSWL